MIYCGIYLREEGKWIESDSSKEFLSGFKCQGTWQSISVNVEYNDWVEIIFLSLWIEINDY